MFRKKKKAAADNAWHLQEDYKNIIEIKNLTHQFVDTDEEGNVVNTENAVNGVTLDVKPGQFIAVLGHNGSGKSTLAKHINAILMPSEGCVFVSGMDTKDRDKLWKIRQQAGMVFQNPDNQIIATVVEEDIGFGPENIGIPTDEIWQRVDYALKAVGMTEYRHHSPNKLSGGQKQRVAIAGVVAMKPKCIVLDEPTAMLDPNGRKEVLKTLKELNEKEKVTIVLITHYMNEVIDADKVFVMDSGKIALSGTPREVFANVDVIKGLGLDVPQITEISHKLKLNGARIDEVVLNIDEFVNAVKGNIKEHLIDEENKIVHLEKPVLDMGEKVMSLKNVNYTYSPDTAFMIHAIKYINLDIYEGQFIGIIGHTGSGKSTLMQHLNGLSKAESGEIYYRGKNIYDEDYKMTDLRKKVGLVFQYPEYQLFESTVLEDVCFGPRNLGLDKEEAVKRALEALKSVGLDEEVYGKSPFEISGGQKRRVAIAGVLAMEPDVLILDEPTAALDPKGRDEILSELKRLHSEKNITIILVSHSMEDVAKYVERIIVMSKGQVAYDDTPAKVFSYYKELEGMGLAAPQVTYAMAALKEKDINVNDYITTVDEAVESLLPLLNLNSKDSREAGGIDAYRYYNRAVLSS